MSASNNLPAVVAPGTYAIATVEPSDVIESLREANVTPFQLLRAKVGAGGMPAFQLDAASGVRVTDTIECIVALQRGGQRAWWRNPMGEGGGNSPPDCSSTDGLSGHGIIDLEPHAGQKPTSHKCAECPWGSFGSKRTGANKVGRGKDCKEFAELYFFETRSRLPKLLVAPATSLKPLRQYAMRLADEGHAYWSVVTRLSLRQTRNADGIAYSVIEAAMVGALPHEEAQRMQGMCAQLRAWATSVNARAPASEFVEHEDRPASRAEPARPHAEEDPAAFADADPLA